MKELFIDKKDYEELAILNLKEKGYHFPTAIIENYIVIVFEGTYYLTSERAKDLLIDTLKDNKKNYGILIYLNEDDLLIQIEMHRSSGEYRKKVIGGK